MEAKRGSFSDRISILPKNIIETILCLVPIKDAVRTSILARNWRCNWTKIPKLVFKEKCFEVPNSKNQLSTVARTFKLPYHELTLLKRRDFFLAVHQVLLLRQGPIHEFTLELMYANVTCHEIDQIILHLSRNHALKKFTLTCNSYKLPSSIFSLHQLTDLYLDQCILDPEPTFNGFGSLISLYLSPEQISLKTLLHLLSNCPLLKTLTLIFGVDVISHYTNSTVIELFECLPMIEHLTMNRSVITCFDIDFLIPEVLPTSMINLKYFCFEEMSFVISGERGLPFLVLLIRSSPNLEKLKLEIDTDYGDEPCIVKIEDYSDIWLEHLNEFEIEYFMNSKLELEFVKLILAKSPVLKILRICICGFISKDEELEMLKILLRSPRVSLAVNIFVERG